MCLLQNAANQNICTQSSKCQILFSKATKPTIGISDITVTYCLIFNARSSFLHVAGSVLKVNGHNEVMSAPILPLGTICWLFQFRVWLEM